MVVADLLAARVVILSALDVDHAQGVADLVHPARVVDPVQLHFAVAHHVAVALVLLQRAAVVVVVPRPLRPLHPRQQFRFLTHRLGSVMRCRWIMRQIHRLPKSYPNFDH